MKLVHEWTQDYATDHEERLPLHSIFETIKVLDSSQDIRNMERIILNVVVKRILYYPKNLIRP